MDSVRGCFGWAARALAGILALLFVLTLPVTIIAYDLGQVVFLPEEMATLVSTSFEEVGGFRRLAMDAIVSDSAAGEGLSLTVALSHLTPMERDYLADRLLPRAWVEEQLHESVVDVYAWIDNDLARPDLRLDLRPVKDAVRSGGADELVQMVVDSWPPCTVEQMSEMAGTVLGLVEGFPFCEPAEPLRTGLVAMAGETLVLSVYTLPDSLSISGAAAPSAADPEILRLKEDVRLARTFSRWGWLISPVLLGLIMALAIRTWRGLAGWWGLPLILGGCLTVIASFASRAGVGSLAARLGAAPGMPPIFGDLVTTAAGAWMSSAMQVVLTHAAVAILIGLAVLGLGLVLGRRAKPPTGGRPRPAAPSSPGPDSKLRFPKDDEGTPTGMFG
jgi:hypothetical protein